MSYLLVTLLNKNFEGLRGVDVLTFETLGRGKTLLLLSTLSNCFSKLERSNSSNTESLSSFKFSFEFKLSLLELFSQSKLSSSTIAANMSSKLLFEIRPSWAELQFVSVENSALKRQLLESKFDESPKNYYVVTLMLATKNKFFKI